MIVYFVASRKNITERIEELRQFVSIIHENGHTLALDWLEPIYAEEKKNKITDVDWPVLYKDTIEAITRADVFIAETSTQSFGVGYQVALAIHLKKPVLLLHNASANESVFASGIPEQNAQIKPYDKDNLKEIIENFLLENTIENKDLRFNFFIDRQIYNYLRWVSVKRNKTKAEILRELVQREIDKDKGL